MASTILKQGSKGKLVEQLQKFLNLKGKTPKRIEENGVFGPETKVAVRRFQQQAKLKSEVNGTVGPETAGALAKLVGPTAASFAKAFGEPGTAPSEDGTKAKQDASKDAGGEEGLPTGGASGKPGKHGNVIHVAGGYWLSLPPSPAGSFPLLMLFGGKGHAADDMMKDTPASYFQKAILIFSVSLGKFPDARARFKAVLERSGSRIGCVSLAGWSLGGQGGMQNYGHATKTVGLMDPTLYYPDLAKLDSKAVLSINPRPSAWGWSGKHPTNKAYTCSDARIEALEVANKKGGFAEPPTGISHGSYPGYFLKKFEARLI